MKRLLGLALVLVTAAACESAEDNNLEAARTCINNAMRTSVTNSALAASQATTCELLTRNMTTAESGKLGFMAILIMEQKITDLADSAGALSGSSNTVGTSLSYMAFPTMTNINQMDTYISRAGSSGITKIGSIIKASTIMKSILGVAFAFGAELTQTNIDNFLAGATPAEEDAAAAALVAFQQSSCSGAGASSTVCTKATQAVGADPTTATVFSTLRAFVGGAG